MPGSSPLDGVLSRFGKTRILVVGDLMLDEFLWGKVSRISPEAPVPVVWVQSESFMPGGAANVASNIRALGGQVIVAGVVGDDRWGEALLSELAARQIDTSAVLKVARPTTVKSRVIAHHQQVVRVDREGVIVPALLEELVPAARKRDIIITVDPKEDHFELYRGVTALTPNRSEAGGAIGRELESDLDVQRAGRDIVRRLRCDGLLITLGEDGMWLFEAGGREVRIQTVAQEVFDVAGAGDTVIATFTLALASGAAMDLAAKLANQAAGVVVGKLGVAVVSPEELRARLNSRAGAAVARRMAGRPPARAVSARR
jgi:D-beta-D-heptose 7-phosphate kinase/D-beta-D-heptose 1-phosphate adenosyltransferase